MAANELSAQLWRERELLELVLFKLDEVNLLLQAGRTRWISRATTELEQVVERVRTSGLGRAIQVAGVAEEWGCSPAAGLRELVAVAPEGLWADIFTAHLLAMTEATSQIRSVSEANRILLRDLEASTDAALDELATTGSPSSPDASLDLQTLNATFRVANDIQGHVLQPALLEFLR